MTHSFFDFNDAPDQVDTTTPQLSTDALKARVLNRLPALLSHVFPKGVRQGQHFLIGDIEGNPGKSLVVTLDGEHAGMWKDFATHHQGDIFTLWGEVHRLDTKTHFPEIVAGLERFLGLPSESLTPSKSAQLSKAELGPHTAKYDYHNADHQLIACIYRYDPPGGKQFRPYDVRTKTFKAPSPRPLYNLPAILSAQRVVLVEGEKCAEALASQGIVATTAMFGSNAPIEKTDWSPLKNKRVIIWPDNDKTGWAYAERVATYLCENHACKVAIVQPPDNKPSKWDAADAIAAGESITEILKTAKPITSPQYANGVQISDWLAHERFEGKPQQREWLIDGIFPLAQPALLAASGGVGKSYLLLQLAREVANFNGFSINAPHLFGGPLTTQGAAVYITAEDDAIEVHGRLNTLGDIPERLYAVPLPDAGGAQPLFVIDPATRSASVTVAWESLTQQLAAIENLKLIILDPLQPLCSLDLNVSENAQFVCSRLSALAAQSGASVIISHHFAKREALSPDQAREAIRGSGGLVDGVRAVYALWQPKPDQAHSICKSLNVPYQRGGVVKGGIVKANGAANLNVITLVREHNGLLLDRSNDLSTRYRQQVDYLPELKRAIAQAAIDGKPYTKTGVNGLYERRFELPDAFHDIGKHKFTTWLDELLAEGDLVAAMADGSKVVKWLDVPTGPVALGEAEFVAGHIKRGVGGRPIKHQKYEYE